MDLDQLLNTSQKAAVEYLEGPNVIVAGAGSGKTRVLTYKIAYMIEQGVRPDSILALTFTNKAAKEMKERISEVVGSTFSRRLWMGTFHSIFCRILRLEAEKIGYDSQFTIYDSADSRNMVKSIIKEMELDDKAYKPKMIYNRISYAKNHLYTPASYRESSELMRHDKVNNVSQFCTIYEKYETRCKQANVMDFDDLLMKTSMLFSQFPEVLERYQERFQYILVDEYQDTNIVQHRIVTLLSSKHQRVSVVGDDAQSIYSFRGANIDNMLTFQNTYPNVKLFKLERNYRSTQTIVNAANSLIANNVHRIKKRVYSELEVGDKINYQLLFNDREEARFVAKELEHQHSKNQLEFEDMAVLYRTNAQSRGLEKELRSLNLPYRIYGGLSFYQRKEIKDILAYLRLTINPMDEEAWRRVINFPKRGIGQTTQNRVLETAHELDRGVMEVLSNPSAYNPTIKGGSALKLTQFYDLVRSFYELSLTENAYQIVERIIQDSGILAEVSKDTTPEVMSQKENVLEFLNAVNEFVETRVNDGNDQVSLADFLSEVSLLTDQDENEEGNNNRITLMTIHAAKGLEFQLVMIVGMEEDLFPSVMSVDNPRAVEEERRLFYVALTRAKQKCYLTGAKSRFRFGSYDNCNPSRFIKEIDAEFIEETTGQGRGMQFGNKASSDGWGNRSENTIPKTQITTSKRPKHTLIKDVPDALATKRLTRIKGNETPNHSVDTVGELSVGDSVTHASFGEGKVLRFDGQEANCKAQIEFKNHGTKTLLLRFARLTKL